MAHGGDKGVGCAQIYPHRMAMLMRGGGFVGFGNLKECHRLLFDAQKPAVCFVVDCVSCVLLQLRYKILNKLRLRQYNLQFCPILLIATIAQLYLIIHLYLFDFCQHAHHIAFF